MRSIKWLTLRLFSTLLLGLVMFTAQAQESPNVTLTLAEERRLGTDCPAASALSPAGDILWVLMHNCGYEDYYLLNFAIGDNSFEFKTNDGEDYTSALTGLDGIYFDGLLNPPLSVGDNGSVQIQVYNSDGNIQMFRPSDGSSEVNPALTEQIINTALYPEFAVFNPDQSAVAVIGEDAVHIFDTQSASEVLAITVEENIDYLQVRFSADGKSIDLIMPNNPDDPNATTATLYRYSVPDGELQMEQSLLTSLAWISPNGQYVLLWMGEDELVVTEPATGGVSEILHMYDAPRAITECANEDGFDPTDLGATWDGFLPPMGINWLPDSSGFVVVNSYMGDGAASDNATCAFSESRLRRYTVGHDG